MNYCSLQWMPGDWGLWECWGHSWRPLLTGRTRITWSGDPALSWEVPLTSWRWWHRGGGGGGEGLNCHCSWMTNTMTTLGSSISDRPLHQRVWRRSFLPAAISTAPHTPQTQCTHNIRQVHYVLNIIMPFSSVWNPVHTVRYSRVFKDTCYINIFRQVISLLCNTNVNISGFYICN